MKVHEITSLSILLVLLIIFSQYSIPIGWIPVTLQTLAVMLIGLWTQPRKAGIVTGLYLVIGLIGLPVFSNGSGGLQTVFKPSFGFIIAFIPAAIIISYINLYQQKIPVIINLLIGNIIIYTLGLIYMAFILNHGMKLGYPLIKILQIGFLPFIPGDLIKVILAAKLGKKVEYLIKDRPML